MESCEQSSFSLQTKTVLVSRRSDSVPYLSSLNARSYILVVSRIQKFLQLSLRHSHDLFDRKMFDTIQQHKRITRLETSSVISSPDFASSVRESFGGSPSLCRVVANFFASFKTNSFISTIMINSVFSILIIIVVFPLTF